MSSTLTSTLSYARSGRGGGTVHIDFVTIALIASISLLGLVMVTSASVSIASQETGQAFTFLLLCHIFLFPTIHSSQRFSRHVCW